MTYSDSFPFVASEIAIETSYQGKRYVRKGKTAYDAKLDKYVTVYTDRTGKEIYGYSESKYVSSTTVVNYITSPSNFSSYAGWKMGESADGNAQKGVLQSVVIPDARDVTDFSEIDNAVSYLQIKFNAKDQELFNSGFADSRSKIEELTKGDKYVFRFKYGIPTINSITGRPSQISATTDKLNFTVREYRIDTENGDYLFVDEDNEDLPLYFSGSVKGKGSESLSGVHTVVES
jgi:hypothetical protein